jgi:hypothetical protein
MQFGFAKDAELDGAVVVVQCCFNTEPKSESLDVGKP